MRGKIIPIEEIRTNGDAAVANMSFREIADMIEMFFDLSADCNLEQLDFLPQTVAKIKAMRELYIERMHKSAGV